jgi:hypothetical protein
MYRDKRMAFSLPGLLRKRVYRDKTVFFHLAGLAKTRLATNLDRYLSNKLIVISELLLRIIAN